MNISSSRITNDINCTTTFAFYNSTCGIPASSADTKDQNNARLTQDFILKNGYRLYENESEVDELLYAATKEAEERCNYMAFCNTLTKENKMIISKCVGKKD